MKTNKIKIEKGIPITPKINKQGYPVRQMKVGDSFFVPHRSSAAMSATMCYWQRKLNIKVTVRKEGNGTRVWRIK